MATKAKIKVKTKTRERTKTEAAGADVVAAAAAAEAGAASPIHPGAAPAPASNAAPVAVPAIVEQVGLRTPSVWSPRDRNPRAPGPLTKTATLRRGVTWTTSYSTGPIVFPFGVPVPITESEFEVLLGAVDRVDFPDPSSGVRIERRIRKFSFADAVTGKEIKLPPLPDREVGPLAMSAGDQAEHDRRFQGQEHTAR